MTDSTIKRRRRRERRRREEDDQTTYQRQAPPKRMPAPPTMNGVLSQWQWRTFPVFFAFVLGVVVMGLVGAAEPTAFAVLLYVALFGVAYSVAHILTRAWLVRRRH